MSGVNDNPPSTGDTRSNWIGASRLSPSTGVMVVEGTNEPVSLKEVCENIAHDIKLRAWVRYSETCVLNGCFPVHDIRHA